MRWCDYLIFYDCKGGHIRYPWEFCSASIFQFFNVRIIVGRVRVFDDDDDDNRGNGNT